MKRKNSFVNTIENITKVKKPNEDTPDTNSTEDDALSLSRFKLPAKRNVQREHLSLEYETPTKTNKQTAGDNKPPGWEIVLQNIRDMHKNFKVPVDSLNCTDENLSPEDTRFQMLISLMLSSRTKDQVTDAAMLKLRKHGCSLINILNISDAELTALIYPTKAKNIKRTALMIRDIFKSDIPKNVEDLCKLPGVGPKMAHLCMNMAWGQVTGIAVDTHVHRVCNRLKWVKSSTPDNTREILENWLPRELWAEVDLVFADFGQKMCLAIKPHCGSCLNKEVCPFASKQCVT